MHSLTWDVYPEAIQPRDGDDFSAIDCSVKGIHCEGRRAVHNAVSRIQTAPHEQVYQLICPASHLQQVIQLGPLKVANNCIIKSQVVWRNMQCTRRFSMGTLLRSARAVRSLLVSGSG